MAQQKGSTTSIMIGFEGSATPGTVATDGFILPVNYGEGVEGTQAINSANTIRGNRNPNQGFRGFRDVAGPVPVPVDSVCLPYWLTALFGDPTSTGAGPYVHEWKVADTQPSFSYEKKFSDLTTDRFFRSLFCKINSMSLEVGGDGELVINFGIVGAQETAETAAFDASPASPALSRINMFNGAVTEGGSASTIVTKVSLDINFGLDVRTENIPIGAGGIRTSIPEGALTISGSVTAQFDDAGYAILAKGIAGTESSLKLTFTASATSVFELEFQEIEYGRKGIPIPNPEGLLVEMPFTAHYENGGEASAIVARITNSVASYNLIT